MTGAPRSTRTASTRTKMPVSIKLIAVLVVVVAVLSAGLWLASSIFGFSILSSSSMVNDRRVVESLTPTEEVSLLAISVQGLTETNENSQVFGVTLPGSGRTKFLQYSFRAKAGVDGAEVQVEQSGVDTYTVRVPRFIFIGHSDVEFKTVVDNNGLLSFITPDIDVAELVTAILDDESQKELVQLNLGVLEEQTKLYYTSLIQSVVPDAEVVFEFLHGEQPVADVNS